jgi:hypothetical protein
MKMNNRMIKRKALKKNKINKIKMRWKTENEPKQAGQDRTKI